jgi:dTDP-4-amino-4,6-dideoxygalactose transaminase
VTNVPFLDLRRQYNSLKDEINEAINDVLESGNFILGEKVAFFEKEFAEYCSVKFGIGMASGTDALHLALLACGVRRGDEVITVSHTAIPTVLAISFTGAKPIFVDINPHTYTMDVSQVENKITNKTKAILPVHLYGHPVDVDPLIEMADKYDLKLIEDACQAHGSTYKGRKVGSFGHVGCFSFYPTKNLGAYGDGGFIGTNDEEISEKVKLLRNYGQRDRQRYIHSLKGYNSRLDELQAAILSVKLKKLDEWNESRRRKAKMYHELLKGTNNVTPIEEVYAKHVYHLYVIRSKHRLELRQWLKSQGIATLIHYPVPVHLQEAYRNLNLRKASFPATEKCAAEVLSLPLYAEITDKEIGIVAKAIKEFNL